MAKIKFPRDLLILLLIPCLLTKMEIAEAQDPTSTPSLSPTLESSEPSSPPLSSDPEFQALSNQIKALEKDRFQLNTKVENLQSKLTISQQKNLKFEDNVKNLQEQIKILKKTEENLKKDLEKQITTLKKTEENLKKDLEKQIKILNDNENKLKQEIQNNSQNLTGDLKKSKLLSSSISIVSLLVSLIAILTCLYIGINSKIERKKIAKYILKKQKSFSELALEDISKINNFIEYNEPKLQLIDKLLSNEETSKFLQNAIKIIGALETIDRSWVNFSEAELIDAYNTIPRLLSQKAIKVSINQEHISTAKENILLTESRNGNYWIIGREDGTYWLLPKSKLKINPYNINTVQSLFECQSYQQGESQEFILQKPARVSILPNGQEWKLEEKGVLDFNNNSQADSSLYSE